MDVGKRAGPGGDRHRGRHNRHVLGTDCGGEGLADKLKKSGGAELGGGARPSYVAAMEITDRDAGSKNGRTETMAMGESIQAIAPGGDVDAGAVEYFFGRIVSEQMVDDKEPEYARYVIDSPMRNPLENSVAVATGPYNFEEVWAITSEKLFCMVYFMHGYIGLHGRCVLQTETRQELHDREVRSTMDPILLSDPQVERRAWHDLELQVDILLFEAMTAAAREWGVAAGPTRMQPRRRRARDGGATGETFHGTVEKTTPCKRTRREGTRGALRRKSAEEDKGGMSCGATPGPSAIHYLQEESPQQEKKGGKEGMDNEEAVGGRGGGNTREQTRVSESEERLMGGQTGGEGTEMAKERGLMEKEGSGGGWVVGQEKGEQMEMETVKDESEDEGRQNQMQEADPLQAAFGLEPMEVDPLPVNLATVPGELPNEGADEEGAPPAQLPPEQKLVAGWLMANLKAKYGPLTDELWDQTYLELFPMLDKSTSLLNVPQNGLQPGVSWTEVWHRVATIVSARFLPPHPTTMEEERQGGMQTAMTSDQERQGGMQTAATNDQANAAQTAQISALQPRDSPPEPDPPDPDENMPLDLVRKKKLRHVIEMGQDTQPLSQAAMWLLPVRKRTGKWEFGLIPVEEGKARGVTIQGWSSFWATTRQGQSEAVNGILQLQLESHIAESMPPGAKL
ncbi:hypothetical protein CBR_g38479 [Chara braunii]|uniref:Uncharacterized protein n=1 Tax=Chara braunii TaxID=69332 RepID=A0A388JNT6_CHABU|nr:hypothetical protein CBR_g38479 [Chara braunii]|eukprot:GBG59454.1 hypothetical protein CBR_g38479 [Chara braunii]